jgi:hypothetical protein
MYTKPIGGTNSRPLNDTIAQTGHGLPDDSSTPVEIDETEAQRIEDKLTGGSPQEKLKKEVAEEIEGPLKGSA